DGDQLGGGLAGQRHGRDERQLVAALGYQPGLQTPYGAERRDADRGVVPAKGVREGERRLDVAGGPPAGENDMHEIHRSLRGRARLSPVMVRRGSPRSLPRAELRAARAALAAGSLRAKQSSMPTANMVGSSADPP